MLARSPYTVPLPQRPAARARCSNAASWASSTSRPIRSLTAVFISTSIGRSPRACRWPADGADIIDVGGESTRPGAEPLPADEELRRVLPVVERLAAGRRVPISIDTYKAAVAREAIARGAAIINDVSGLQYDAGLGQVAGDRGPRWS